MRDTGKEDKAATKTQLSGLIETMFCRQDFDEWLEEMNDSDTCEIARNNICEGLRALQIPHSANKSYRYYQNIVLKHSTETGKIVSFEEMENRLLLCLFEAWINNENKELRDKISHCLPGKRLATNGLCGKTNEYYSEVCIYYEDDICRMGGDTQTSYHLWFDDEKYWNEHLNSLLGASADHYCQEIVAFIHNMFTIDGLLPDGKSHKGSYRFSVVPRNYLIWLSSTYEVAENYCFGRENHKIFPATACSLSSQELRAAGYEGKNYNNCLDVYCAFSAYNYMRNNLPKCKRIWPGRKLHGKNNRYK